MPAQRVTLVAPYDVGQPTGILAYVHELVRQAPDDLDVRVVNLRKRELMVKGKRYGGTLSTWAQLSTLRLGKDAGLVHATDTFCLAKGTQALTIHDLIPALVSRHLGARLHTRLFANRIQATRQILCDTQVVADQVVERLGIPAERVETIPLGYDDAAFRPNPATPAAIAPDKRNLVYVGAYRPYKHIDLVLQALAGTNVRFLRIGPPGNDAYYQQCLAAAKAGNVDFVDVGYVSKAELAAYYTAADLAVYPSRDEGFGIPPLEAMGCGTATLLSDIPVFREIYGSEAHYVDSFEPAAIHLAIQAALEDPIPAERLKEHAARFTWGKTTRRTYDVYRRLLGS